MPGRNSADRLQPIRQHPHWYAQRENGGSALVCYPRAVYRPREWGIARENNMAGSVNKVILVGNLGADPEVRSFPNGGRVCNLSVATSERWKDRNTGEQRERTEWHRVCIYSEPLIGVAERYLQKGRKVYIEGQLETRKWQDQAGQDRYTTEVAMRPFRSELTLLDSRGGEGGREPDSGSWGGGRDAEGPSGGGLDDEIPF